MHNMGSGSNTTNTGLLHITELIRGELDNGKGVGLVALDLSKAFNKTDHNILIKKLCNYGLGPSTIMFFVRYLEERTFVVKTPEDRPTSQITSINAGVPQGSIMGPLLLIIYVNDLPRAVHHSNVIMYADDTTVIASATLPCNLQVKLAEDLAMLEKWFSENTYTKRQ